MKYIFIFTRFPWKQHFFLSGTEATATIVLAAPVAFQQKSWVFLYRVTLVAAISEDCLHRISLITTARLLEPPLGHVTSQFVGEETLGV